MDQLHIKDVHDSERHSLASSNTDNYSTLSESHGLILENLDGTYCRAVNVKAVKDEPNPAQQQDSRFEDYPRHRILYVVDDDEIAFYSGFFEIPSNVDDFLTLFIKHQKYFAMFLSFLFIFEIILGFFAYVDREKAIDQLIRTYQNPAHDMFEKVYVGAIFAEIMYMVIYYPLGWIAAHRRSVKLYGWFSSFSLIGLIFQMILAYANRFEITIFLFRFGGFVYSRFLNQLLVSLLLLPR